MASSSSSTSRISAGAPDAELRAGVHVRPKGTSTAIMLATTAILLALIFPPFYCFFLAPVALVPFCLCILRRPLNKRHVLFYYLTGAGFFVPNLFWLAPVTVFGYMALALFVALYFALFAIAFRQLVVQLRLPAMFALPLAWTAIEYVRACFIEGGFPWFLLGNSLAPWPVLIQTADLFGVWGLTFFIATLNGYVVDVFRLPLWQPQAGGRGRFSPVIGALTAVMACIVAFVFVYGAFRLGQQTTHPGPRLAVIQENIPQSLKESRSGDDDILKRHVELTKQAAAQNPKPDLIAWPETMLPANGNPEFLKSKDEQYAKFESKGPEFWPYYRDRSNLYIDYVQAVSDDNDVPLLLGIQSLEPRGTYSNSIKQNRTFLMAPHAGLIDYYAKRHLVPWGEYIPFRSAPVIGPLMLMLSPLEGMDFSNTPGDRWHRFGLPVSAYGNPPAQLVPGAKPVPVNPTYTFATPICFEDAMPDPCRKLSAPEFDDSGAGRKTDFLINVSNDGWFHWVELDQHLQACQIRAVENRIAIARAVNTGNSGFIDSNGRIIRLVANAEGASIGAIGTAAAAMPIDSRITLFSKIGDLFPLVCGILVVVLVGWTVVRPRRGPKQNP